MSDADLLEDIARDPRTGIETAILRHGPQLLGRLTGRAKRLNLDATSAEDVFQDAILRLLVPRVREEILRHGGQILPWLTRWGYWRLSDVRRKQSKIDPVGAAAAVANDEATSAGAALVGEVLPNLRPRDQQVLRLKYQERLTDAAVAQQLGISAAAAKKAAHDARRRLKKLMIEAGYNPDEEA